MTKVLVTGGVGFIGSHLTNELLTRGYHVRVLDNLNPQIHGVDHQLPSYFPDDVEFVFADIRDRRALAYALKNVDIVFHLAAETGVGQSMYEAGEYAQTNVAGTATLWDAIHAVGGIKKLVLASSRAVYGEGTYSCQSCGRVKPEIRHPERLAEGQWSPSCPRCSSPIHPVATREEDRLSPTSVYGITKHTQEQLSLTLGRSYDIPVTVLRFFNVYGSRQSLSNPYTGILATFLAHIRSGKALLIYEDGEQLRDFVHVEDVVRACMLAATHNQANFEIFNVGSGKAVSISQLARTLLDLIGKDEIALRVTGQYRLGDIRDCYADIGKIKTTLGYEPSVSLAEGLQEFLDWAESEPLMDRTEEAAEELASAGLLRCAYEGDGNV
jgi:dTDP-L-rhamnose 4-epimerase